MNEELSCDGVTYIYGLTDPRTMEVRYVGKSNNPKARLAIHLLGTTIERYADNPHKTNWLKSLRSLDLDPILAILEIVPIEKWQEREIWWIAELRSRGSKLTNATYGGEGGTPSEETRRRLSIAGTGKKHSPETKSKMSESAKGRPRSDTTRAKLSAAHKGRKPPQMSAESRARITASLIGRVRSAEELQKDKEGAQKRRERAGIMLPKEVPVNCTYCDVQFLKAYKALNKSKNGRHFCSIEHVHAFVRDNPEIIRERNPDGWVMRECAFCKKGIQKRVSELCRSRSGLYFCDAAHRTEYDREYGLPRTRNA